jgi:hypothetical protein
MRQHAEKVERRPAGQAGGPGAIPRR